VNRRLVSNTGGGNKSIESVFVHEQQKNIRFWKAPGNPLLRQHPQVWFRQVLRGFSAPVEQHLLEYLLSPTLWLSGYDLLGLIGISMKKAA